MQGAYLVRYTGYVKGETAVAWGSRLVVVCSLAPIRHVAGTEFRVLPGILYSRVAPDLIRVFIARNSPTATQEEWDERHPQINKDSVGNFWLFIYVGHALTIVRQVQVQIAGSHLNLGRADHGVDRQSSRSSLVI